VLIVLAEDSLLVREGLTRLLEALGHHVAAAVERPEVLLAEVAVHEPALVVIDIRMPPTFTDEGLRAAAQIRAKHPSTGVLVLSQYVVPQYATWLLDHAPSGVGYLLKERILNGPALGDALLRVADGGTVVDPELVRGLVRARDGAGPLAKLTGREREVLSLMAEGLSDRGIAARLVVSLNTVGTHIQHVFAKLGLPGDETENRRVRAVLTWLQHAEPTVR